MHQQRKNQNEESSRGGVFIRLYVRALFPHDVVPFWSEEDPQIAVQPQKLGEVGCSGFTPYCRYIKGPIRTQRGLWGVWACMHPASPTPRCRAHNDLQVQLLTCSPDMHARDHTRSHTIALSCKINHITIITPPPPSPRLLPCCPHMRAQCTSQARSLLMLRTSEDSRTTRERTVQPPVAQLRSAPPSSEIGCIGHHHTSPSSGRGCAATAVVMRRRLYMRCINM